MRILNKRGFPLGPVSKGKKLHDKHDNNYMIDRPYFSNEIHSNRLPSKSVATAYMDSWLFCRPPYSILNDEHDNDYMINWLYLSNEKSSKSTIIHSLKKCHHCVWIRDFSADPLIAHSMMNMTMIIWSTDYTFLMKYHQNPQ